MRIHGAYEHSFIGHEPDGAFECGDDLRRREDRLEGAAYVVHDRAFYAAENDRVGGKGCPVGEAFQVDWPCLLDLGDARLLDAPGESEVDA